jgi:hypothetical protein
MVNRLPRPLRIQLCRKNRSAIFTREQQATSGGVPNWGQLQNVRLLDLMEYPDFDLIESVAGESVGSYMVRLLRHLNVSAPVFTAVLRIAH